MPSTSDLFAQALEDLRAGVRMPVEQPCNHRLERVELARPIGNFELHLDDVGPQIFADRVSRQVRPSRYLSDRKLVPKSPAPDNAQ